MSTGVPSGKETAPALSATPSLREILDVRAELLAEPLPLEPLASEFVEVLTFVVGQERFAIDTRFVTEVLHNVQITPLPGHTEPLVGVINLRGEVLAVMTLSGVLQCESRTAPMVSGRWVIVLGDDQARFGIGVAAATERARYDCRGRDPRT